MGINETATIVTDNLGVRREDERVRRGATETPDDIEAIPEAGAQTQLGERALRLAACLRSSDANTTPTDFSDIGSELPRSDEGDDGDFDELLRGATLSSDPTTDYLRKIGKIPLLTASQEVNLGKAIEAGVFAKAVVDGEIVVGRYDTQGIDQNIKEGLMILAQEGATARERMIEANLRLVVSVAKRYTGRGLDFLDLIQEGNNGLMRAVDKFDYKQGNKFSTYATGGFGSQSRGY